MVVNGGEDRLVGGKGEEGKREIRKAVPHGAERADPAVSRFAG